MFNLEKCRIVCQLGTENCLLGTGSAVGKLQGNCRERDCALWSARQMRLAACRLPLAPTTIYVLAWNFSQKTKEIPSVQRNVKATWMWICRGVGSVRTRTRMRMRESSTTTSRFDWGDADAAAAAAADILHFMQRIPWGAAGRMRTTHQGGGNNDDDDDGNGDADIERCGQHWHWWAGEDVARGAGSLLPAAAGSQGGHPKCNTQRQQQQQ